MKKIILMLLLTIFSNMAQCDNIDIKKVKYFIIADDIIKQKLKISGVVRAETRTDLSFKINGKVNSIMVQVGDMVDKEQRLSTLDKIDYEIEVEKAKANVAIAEANLANSKAVLDRFNDLIKKGFTSELTVEEVDTNFKVAKSQLLIAEYELRQANINLDRTTLTAPFAGNIISKYIDPFMEITSGQKAFELEGLEDFKVEILIPESIIQYIKLNMPVTISFPAINLHKVKGVVSDVTYHAKVGNAFAAKVKISESEHNILSGMTANVFFLFEKKDLMLIPISAINLRHGKSAYVYVFEQATSKVKQREVIMENFINNKAIIKSGLKLGEKIITSGTNYMRDGQQVQLWIEEK